MTTTQYIVTKLARNGIKLPQGQLARLVASLKRDRKETSAAFMRAQLDNYIATHRAAR